MLKKMAILFVILSSSVFAQWEKEYVKDEFRVPTKNYYLVHEGHDNSPSMLVTKSNIIVQLNERAKENLYTSSLINELVKVTDEKGKTYNIEATILIDLDNATPYSIIISRKNKTMVNLMKENENLVFQVGKTGSYKKFNVSFHDFDEVYDEALANKFRDRK